MPTLGIWEFDILEDDPLRLAESLTVTVRNEATGDLVSVFEDRDGNTPLDNPFSVSDGRVLFYADQSRLYRIEVSGNGSRTFRYRAVSQELGTAATRDVGTGAEDVPTNDDLEAGNVSYDNTESGLNAEDVQAAIDELADVDVEAEAHDVGEVFYLWDHLDGVEEPDNSGDATYIRLTADDSYNDGLLTNEIVSGSHPLVEATAEIDVGPLQGETVHLINTEQAVLRARETSGALQMDQMQRITGDVNTSPPRGIYGSSNGCISVSGGNTTNASGGSNASPGNAISFNSANSPNARTSPGTGGETRAKNVSATAYMRIA